MSGKIGDKVDVLTWAAYNRYPLYSFALLVIGGVLGVLVAGLTGLLVGALGGGLIGLFVGLILGKDKKMFTFYVERWIAFGGGGKPKIYKELPAKVVTITFSDDKGFTEHKVVKYLDGMWLRELPNFTLPVWFRQNDGNEVLPVLQIDSRKWLALLWHDGVLYADDAPVYKTRRLRNEKGEEVLDYERDANGEPIIERQERYTVLDTNIANYDGKLIRVSKGTGAQMDNERFAYTHAVRNAYAFNSFGGFFSKNQSTLVAIVGMVAMVLVVIYGLGEFNKAADKIASASSQAVISASQANIKAAEVNARTMQALLKVGFNYSEAIVADTINVGSSPPVPSGGGVVNPIKIPFLGG